MLQAWRIAKWISMQANLTHPLNPNIKRICLASLVNAVYKLETCRNREQDLTAASKWYETFNHELHQILCTPSDGSIFGAAFVLSGTVVVAFRGTIFSRANIIADLHDDLKLTVQQIHKVSRVDEALRVTREMVAEYGPQNVYLAGHSLGAAIAMQVGRKMAMEGIMLDTHLFNPPFVSLIPLRHEIVGSFNEKSRQSAAWLLSKSSKDNDSRAQAEATFIALQKWYPNLYINASDPVSCNYLHYFRARKSCTAQNSIINSLMDLLGKTPEPHHLLPSANLFVNSTLPWKFNAADGLYKRWFRKVTETKRSLYEWWSRKFNVAHALYQWWSEDTPPLQDEEYRLDVQQFADMVNMFVEVDQEISEMSHSEINDDRFH